MAAYEDKAQDMENIQKQLRTGEYLETAKQQVNPGNNLNVGETQRMSSKPPWNMDK